MKRVLIVDDDIDILDALGDVLSEHYEIRSAQNGLQALHVLDAGSVDAIILDLMMPVMDGAAFIDALVQRQLDIPVIIASASTRLAHFISERPVVDSLSKPFDVEELERKLERALAGPDSGGGTSGNEGVSGADSASATHGDRQSSAATWDAAAWRGPAWST